MDVDVDVDVDDKKHAVAGGSGNGLPGPNFKPNKEGRKLSERCKRETAVMWQTKEEKTRSSRTRIKVDTMRYTE